jgi:hypothetical protein
MNADAISCVTKNRIFVFVFFLFTVPHTLSAQVKTIQDQPPIVCKQQEGVWVKSNGDNVCFTCPTRTLLESSFMGVKLPRGCKVDKEEVFLKLPDYETLKISQEYVFEIEKYQQNIDHLKFVINDRLDQTMVVLAKTEKEKKDMWQNIQNIQLEKNKLEANLNLSLWVGGIAIGLVVIESSILLYQSIH